MRYILALLGVVALAPAYALERSVPLPYTYQNTLPSAQVLTVNSVPDCADGEYLTKKAGVFSCKTLPVAATPTPTTPPPVPAGTYCGSFQSFSMQSTHSESQPPMGGGGPYYHLKVLAACTGMTTTTAKDGRYTYTALSACPAGYALSVTNQQTSGAKSGGCNSCSSYTETTTNYTCIKQ